MSIIYIAVIECNNHRGSDVDISEFKDELFLTEEMPNKYLAVKGESLRIWPNPNDSTVMISDNTVAIKYDSSDELSSMHNSPINPRLNGRKK